jgi:glycosyltransferase involved in cell wall biosynthesis
MLAYWVAGIILALFWLDRLRDAAGGMPGIADITRPEWTTLPAAAPRVSLIVPARNEAAQVEEALRSMLRLDYPDFEIIAVNDRSSDATGEIMERVAAEHAGARLKIFHIAELPEGWLGKPHAMWTAARQATGAWLLFTDADVVFHPESLRRAISYGEQAGADHVVLSPNHVLRSWGEKMMLAGFQFLFVFGNRPWKVADPRAGDFLGLGPFNLVRRSAYEKLGTFRALRMEVIEDMKLGKLVKQHGLASRYVLGPGLLSWHWGHGALGVVGNLTKNLFAAMQYRWGKALGACLLLLFLDLMPLAGLALAPGWAKLGYAVALGCIAVLHVGMARRTPVPMWTFFLYPVSTLLIVLAMLRSMAHAWRHRGVVWRGTRYPLDELRRGLV